MPPSSIMVSDWIDVQDVIADHVLAFYLCNDEVVESKVGMKAVTDGT